MSDNNIYKVLAIDKVGQGNSNNIDNSKFIINVPEPTCYYMHDTANENYELHLFIPGLFDYSMSSIFISDEYLEDVYYDSEANIKFNNVYYNANNTDGVMLPVQNITILRFEYVYNMQNGDNIPILPKHNNSYIYLFHYNSSSGSSEQHMTDIFKYQNEKNDCLTYVKTITKASNS